MQTSVRVKRAGSKSPVTSKLQLDRVVGVEGAHHHAVAVNSVNGYVAYAAGFLCIVYDPKTNAQVRFYKAQETVTCVALSLDGALVAAGQAGKHGTIEIWSIASNVMVAKLVGHRDGVACVAFATSGAFAASVGFQKDGQVMLWDVETSTCIAACREPSLLWSIAFARQSDDAPEVVVACGANGVVFLDITPSSSNPSTSIQPLEPTPVYIPSSCPEFDVFTAVFTLATSLTGYAVTRCGHLVAIDLSTRTVDKFVRVSEGGKCFTVTATSELVIVGANNGICRIFNAGTLEFLKSVPLPPAITAVNVHSRSTSTPRHLPLPATVAVGVSENGGRIIVLYGDTSMFVWNSKRIYQSPDKFSLTFSKYRSFLHHSGVITGVSVCGSMLGSSLAGGFVSCGSDGSVRFWNFSSSSSSNVSGGDGTPRPQTSVTELSDAPESTPRPQTAPNTAQFPKNLLSKDMACAAFLNWKHDEGTVESCAVEKVVVDTPLTAESYLSSMWKESSAIGCMAVMRSGQHVAVGDSHGYVHIVSSVSHSCDVIVPPVKDLAVTCMEYSGDLGDALFVAYSDGSIRACDVMRSYAVTQTFVMHTVAVTALRVTSDGQCLVSADASGKLVFTTFLKEGDGPRHVVKQKTVATGTPIAALAIDPLNRTVAAVDAKAVTIWALQTCKPVRTYSIGPSSAPNTSQLSVDAPLDTTFAHQSISLDPSGLFFAYTTPSGMIRFHDYFTGECLSRVSGHSGGTTGLAFSSDCRVLVSVGRDGCLILWRIAPSITKVMLERLVEMNEAKPASEIQASPPVVSDPAEADLSLDEQSVLSGIGPPLPSIQSPKHPLQDSMTFTQSYMDSVDGDAVAESFMQLPLPPRDVKGDVVVEPDVTPRIASNTLLPPPVPIRTGGFTGRPNAIVEAAQAVLDTTPEDGPVLVDDRSELSSLSHSSDDDDDVIQPVSSDDETTNRSTMDATQHDTFALESFHHIEPQSLLGEEKTPEEEEETPCHPVPVAPVIQSSTFLTQPPEPEGFVPADMSPLLPSPHLLLSDDITSQLATTTTSLNHAAAAIRTGTLQGSQREVVVNQLLGLRSEIDAMLSLLSPEPVETSSSSALQRTVVTVPLHAGESSTSIDLDLTDVAAALTGRLLSAIREKLSLTSANQ